MITLLLALQLLTAPAQCPGFTITSSTMEIRTPLEHDLWNALVCERERSLTATSTAPIVVEPQPDASWEPGLVTGVVAVVVGVVGVAVGYFVGHAH